ncbi:hypothetical protein KM1_080550 [Entamoeba histolytica HM-3:IMSS]|uniref:Uncharacterized protein n=1 Tax=Entamoeba histolytica HM-3:IMSS TaxID=885315 RepID=M7W3V9_ENTHI|nr:hypothetical protein KM1_080550 [Entamoeba histolytica HM-3:IMSS]
MEIIIERIFNGYKVYLKAEEAPILTKETLISEVKLQGDETLISKEKEKQEPSQTGIATKEIPTTTLQTQKETHISSDTTETETQSPKAEKAMPQKEEKHTSETLPPQPQQKEKVLVKHIKTNNHAHHHKKRKMKITPHHQSK